MKKDLLIKTLCIVIFGIFICNAFPLNAFEVKPLALPRFEILIPGKTRIIEVAQELDYPQDLSQILILVIGYGGVGIRMRQNDEVTVENELVLTGVGVSSAGIIPFYNFGRTHVILEAAIEIGNEGSPCGLIWVSSWIKPPLPKSPDNQYTLTLSSYLTF